MRKSSAANRYGPMTRCASRRSGFTLIEILVVLGIILLLSGILLTAVVRARKTAGGIRLKADLQAIGSALDAYRQDFGDYPRSTLANTNRVGAFVAGGSNAYATSDQGDKDLVDSGAILLCWALLAPGPFQTDGFGLRDSAGTELLDTANGNVNQPDFGFMDRPSAFGGKARLPYLKPENWKIRTRFGKGAVKGSIKPSDSPPYTPFCYELRDVNDVTILYYPRIRGNPVTPQPVNLGNRATAAVAYTSSVVNGSVAIDPTRWVAPYDSAIYNLLDNPAYFNFSSTDISVSTQAVADPNNTILRAVQDAKFMGPYLLWDAGNDGRFGLPAGVVDPGKVDDVSNIP